MFIKKLPNPQNSEEARKRGINKIVAKIREFIITEVLNSTRITTQFTPPTDNDDKGKERNKNEENNKDEPVDNKDDAKDKKTGKSEEDDSNKNKAENENSEVEKPAETTSPLPIQYLMGFARDINGFNKVVETQQEDTFFKIFDIQDDTAKFDLCVDVQRAKENNIFEYAAICLEVEKGKGEAGELKYNCYKEKWEVTQPAKIEFA